MDTKKNERKKIPVFKNYSEEIGQDLIKEAKRIGNPCAFVCAKHGLNDKLFSAWLGNGYDGQYRQEHFCECYEKFRKLRKDFLDSYAMSGKMNRDLWSCLQWSQLNEKVNPPKEITCEADVKTTMKVEDLNNIIQRLEEKKNTSGF